MILVILGHINFANSVLKAWIYAFHMPAFFFISGATLKNIEGPHEKCAAYIYNKFKCIMIPYFLWAIIYAKFSYVNLLKIFYGSYHTISSSGSLSSLWFLPTLFISIVLFVTIQFSLKRKFNICIKLIILAFSFLIAIKLPVVDLGYPWSLNIAMMAFCYLVAGNILFPYIQQFRQNCAQFVRSKRTIIYLSAILIFFVGSLLYKYNCLYMNGYVLMANAQYGNELLFLINAFFGIGLIIFVSIILDELISKQDGYLPNWLLFVGRNTMVIFAVHKPIISLFKELFTWVSVNVYLQLFITCLFTLVLSCLMSLFVNKSIPILAGKNNSLTNVSEDFRYG